MCAYLMDTDFTVCFQSEDIEDIWSTIKSVIYDALSLIIPKMYVKHRKCPKWFNSDIRHYLNCLRTLRRRNKSRPSNNLMRKIQISEELLKLKMTQAKSNFESKLIESLQSDTSSNIFRYIYIRNIVGCNDLPVSMSLDSACLSSDPDKASAFNQHFYSIFNQTSFEIPSISDLPRPSTFKLLAHQFAYLYYKHHDNLLGNNSWTATILSAAVESTSTENSAPFLHGRQ